MSESSRILNLDEVQTVEVILGGRSFRITQQRRAILEKVLKIAHEEGQVAREGDDRPLSERLFENWDAALPAFALILGEEEGTPGFDATVAHLEEHLRVPAALQIYEAWWELNQIQGFFDRGGRPLLPPYILKALQDGTLTPPE